MQVGGAEPVNSFKKSRSYDEVLSIINQFLPVAREPMRQTIVDGFRLRLGDLRAAMGVSNFFKVRDLCLLALGQSKVRLVIL